MQENFGNTNMGFKETRERREVDYFCKHFGQLVNQGITFCNIDALAKYECNENCPLREPYTMEVEDRACTFNPDEIQYIDINEQD